MANKHDSLSTNLKKGTVGKLKQVELVEQVLAYSLALKITRESLAESEKNLHASAAINQRLRESNDKERDKIAKMDEEAKKYKAQLKSARFGK